MINMTLRISDSLHAAIKKLAAVIVSSQYQIVIPADVRKHLNLATGDQLEVVLFDGGLQLVLVKPPSALRGVLKEKENTFVREEDRRFHGR